MRPVINERASACRCAVFDNLGMRVRRIKIKIVIQAINGSKNQESNAARTKPDVIKYTMTYTNISASVSTVSRTASAVCITLADTLPANSS